MGPSIMHTITLESPADYLDWRQDGDMVEIINIMVSVRGEGRGRRLVELLKSRVRSWCRLIYAKTRVENRMAHVFYMKVGFLPMGTLTDFYGPGQNAVVYGLSSPERG